MAQVELKYRALNPSGTFSLTLNPRFSNLERDTKPKISFAEVVKHYREHQRPLRSPRTLQKEWTQEDRFASCHIRTRQNRNFRIPSREIFSDHDVSSLCYRRDLPAPVLFPVTCEFLAAISRAMPGFPAKMARATSCATPPEYTATASQ
jgi:hypothetical protein